MANPLSTGSSAVAGVTGTPGRYALLLVPDYDVSTTGPAAAPQETYLRLGQAAAADVSESIAGVLGRFEGTNAGLRVHTDGRTVQTSGGGMLEVVARPAETHVRSSGELWPTGTAEVDKVPANLPQADDVYVRYGKRSGWPHLPRFLDADPIKKVEIEDIVKLLTGQATPTATSTLPATAIREFGWEDHVAAHRLTTTSGDKVEIIKGKSYVHVLGADDFDVSEGMKSVARTGNMPSPALSAEQQAHENETKRPFIVERAWLKRRLAETWIGTHRNTPVSKLPADSLINVDGSVNCDVVGTDALDRTIADGESREFTYADRLTSFTYARRIEERTGDPSSWVDDVEEHSYVKRINSFTTAEAVNEVSMVKGAMASTTLCPVQVDTSINGFTGEFHLGGLTLAIELCGKVEITGPAGLRTEISLPKKNEVDVEKLASSLKRLEITVDNMEMSLTDKSVALETAVIALQVRLGI